MENYLNPVIEIIKRLQEKDRKEISDLLSLYNLRLEDDLDETAVIRDENGIVAAAGSSSGNVLKCIAVRPDLKGGNITGLIITELINRLYHSGKSDLFIFTKPENSSIFSNLGFHKIYEVPGEAILMENNRTGISGYIKTLQQETESAAGPYSGAAQADGRISSIVVNCNPFTRGHYYLIEKAAAESDQLHVFVVSEDRSVFPSETRFRLVKEGTADLKNVIVHRGGSYIISASTFPSYFIKDEKKIIDIHAKMDLGIFSEIIAPALGIKKRYAGEEPFCPVTDNYNRHMSEILPRRDIEFIIIRRFEKEGNPVSASRVRKLLAEGKPEEAGKLVPETTYNFLCSAEGEKIINKIRGSLK